LQPESGDASDVSRRQAVPARLKKDLQAVAATIQLQLRASFHPRGCGEGAPVSSLPLEFFCRHLTGFVQPGCTIEALPGQLGWLRSPSPSLASSNPFSPAAAGVRELVLR
jgi:hypothetical protein